MEWRLSVSITSVLADHALDVDERSLLLLVPLRHLFALERCERLLRARFLGNPLHVLLYILNLVGEVVVASTRVFELLSPLEILDFELTNLALQFLLFILQDVVLVRQRRQLMLEFIEF